MDNIRRKSLSSRHVKSWVGAGVIIALWIFAVNIFETLRSSFEASIAVSQINDSIIQYSLIQKMMYGDLGIALIDLCFVVAIVLCLIPTINDLIKSGRNK